MKREFGCARGEVGKEDLVCQFFRSFVPFVEQREIAAYLDRKCAAIDAVVAKRRKQLEGLADYRNGMIYAYVKGKKEVA